jgi:hypothetical protein
MVDFAALTVRQNEQALANIPKHLLKYAGQKLGSENVEREDLLIPRLSIAQSLSPELKKTNEAYIPELKLGDVFNTVTHEIYGDESIELTVIPLSFYKNYITFKKGGGVEKMYDHKSQVPPADLQFTENAAKESVKPLCTEFRNFLILKLSENARPAMMCVSFKSSGTKQAKQWNSYIDATKLPAFARTYRLSVVEKVDGQNSWYQFVVTPDVFAPEEFFNEAKAYFDQITKEGFKVDTSGLDEDESNGQTIDQEAPGF